MDNDFVDNFVVPLEYKKPMSLISPGRGFKYQRLWSPALAGEGHLPYLIM